MSNKVIFGLLPLLFSSVSCSREEQQLYEDIMYFYRSEVRPVVKDTDKVTVFFGASLIRLIELNEKDQLLTLNLWLEMQWMDPKLRWNPASYGNLTKIHISSELLWTPDIVLYDNAAGDPQVTIFNDALVYYDGTVNWKPPAIYKSFCGIDIRYFPFDEQKCEMKFGGWSNNGQTMDIRQLIDENRNQKLILIDEPDGHGKIDKAFYNAEGMDLSYYQKHPQWDLINVTSRRHEKTYAGCCGLDYFVDVTFYIQFRRKPLFFAVNLVIPCMLLALMTPFVFYVPAEGHKMTFAISIMLTLMVFMLVLAELIPPVSLSIPLMGVYLLFTMLLITFSIFMSTLALSIHHQGSSFRETPKWMKKIFVNTLPKYLWLKPYEEPDPEKTEQDHTASADTKVNVETPKSATSTSSFDKADLTDKLRHKDRGGKKRCSLNLSPRSSPSSRSQKLPNEVTDTTKFVHYREGSPVLFDPNPRLINEELNKVDISVLVSQSHPVLIERMLRQTKYIADYFRRRADEARISDEWNYVAMVLDRVCLVVFTLLNIMGTCMIIVNAPSLWDNRKALPYGTQMPTKPLGGDTGNVTGPWLDPTQYEN